MLRGAVRAVARSIKGVWAALRARPIIFAAVAAVTFGLHVFLPPVVLSLTRKPWDYFTFNPWLRKLPGYLVSSHDSMRRKLEVLANLALFWFSADSPYGGVEWGFAVVGSDLARFVFMSILVGTYFALWFYRRDRFPAWGWGARRSRQGGVTGALASVFGLSTGPCSVVGCGAPVIPVVGLAFVGLSSGTLKFLAEFSRVASTTVLLAMTLGVAYLGWLAGADRSLGPRGGP